VKVRRIVTNFTSGEIDPLLHGRADIKHYYNGAERLRDVLVLPQGGAQRRPGLRYLGQVPYRPVRLTGPGITAPNGAGAIGGGRWAAAGAPDGTDAYILTSTDGFTTKVERTTPKNIAVRAVAYGLINGVGYWGGVGDADGTDAYITYTDDSTTWPELENPKNIGLRGIAYGSLAGVPGFAAVGAADGADAYALFYDGITLTEVANPKNIGLNDVHYFGGVWVAVGDADGVDAYAVFTEDGITINEIANPKNKALYGVANGAGLWAAVGEADGTDAYIVTSPDAVTVTERANPKNITLRAITRGAGVFVAVGDADGGDAYIVTSPDGITWTERANPKNFGLNSVWFGDGVFVAVGAPDGVDAYIVVSTDGGVTWAEEANPKNIALYAVYHDGSTGTATGNAANANDDNTETEVLTTTAVGVINPYVVVQYDFGTPVTIAYIDVVGLRLTAGSVSNEFYIQYSSDASAWTSLGAAIPASTTDTHRRRGVAPDTISARYVRLARIGATNLGAAVVAIDELNVWSPASTAGVFQLSACRLVGFDFSDDQHYILAVTDGNARVYRGGVYQADIRLPRATDAQLAQFDWVQSLDTIIAVHPDAPPLKVVRQGAHDQWQADYIAFDYIPKHAFTPVESNPALTLTPSAVSGNVTLTASGAAFTAAHVDQIIDGNGGRARITQYVSTTVVKARVSIPFYDTNAIASGAWTLETGYEDVWSATRGWPRTTVFHEGRLVFGGSTSRPSTLWFSRAGQFFSFDPGQNLDDDAMDVTINADNVPEIRNMNSGRHLTIFTSVSEYYIPQFQDSPLTPSTITVKLATSRGAKSGLRPQEVSGAVLFMQREGKALREFLFVDTEQSYVASNLSLLSSHLINNPVDMDLRKSTSTEEADFLLIVNGDGTMAVLTTLREQEVTAWSLMTTQGLFKAVGVDRSDVYVIVDRVLVGGTTVRCLEVADRSVHTDCAVYKTAGGGASAIPTYGLTVKIVADGIPQTAATGGAGVLDAYSYTSQIEAGFAFTPQIKTLPLVVELQEGQTMNKKKRINELMLNLYQTQEFLVDGKLPSFRQFGGPVFDTATALYTGRKVIEGRLGWDDLGQLDITQPLPLSLTLLGMELKVAA